MNEKCVGLETNNNFQAAAGVGESLRIDLWLCVVEES